MGFDYNESSEVFGLNYNDHNIRKIRHILKFYGELPENQESRPALFLRLQALEKELFEGVCRKIEDWLINGGDLPNRHTVVEATDTVIDTSGGLNEGANTSDEVDDEEVTDDDVTEDGLTDEDIPFEQYLPEDMESYLQRHPEFDLLDLVPQHPGNPERAAYMMGEEDTPPPSSDSEDDSEEEQEEEEEETDEEEDYDDGEESDDERNETDTGTDPATAKSDFPYDTETQSRKSSLVECGKASRTVFERYEYLSDKASRPGNFIECLGPECVAGQVHEGSEPVMICHHCKFKTCVKHKLPWHEGLSCDDFDIDESQIERLEQAEATAKFLAKNSGICSNCKECVMRTEGCDHMSCVCGHSWCYLCGADSENIIRHGPTAHSRNCPNHPDPHKLSQSQMKAHETHLTQLAHGRPINERLYQARYARNAARREQMRPLALAAAEQKLRDQTSEKTKSVLTSHPRGQS
ncbi:hypothetical protein DID88_008342 [Monilinia fructigena]|uniref:RBR-type E3 ubiquitin transferase n=1 Tax=Monilinia fructigena TaxID=38457 RepID=A0A395JA49_9HELO|nr:hypothetical protein DID88_008342 [Monilinia fructigena]